MVDSDRTGSHPNAASGDDVRHERRLLTALCYDLVGSTELLGLLDIEDFEDLVSDFQHSVKQAIISCSGTLRVEVGDGGVAVFPIDIGDHDAASLAIRAGLKIIHACRLLALRRGRTDLHVRVGVATSMTLIQKGDVTAGQESITGPAFAMAARLQALAMPDTVYVSDETRELARRSHAFRPRGSHAIKGFAGPKQIWQALNHKREVDRFFAFGRMTSPLVDRIDEFALIRSCWQDAVAGRGQVLLIEGEAGIGKSRIVHELRRQTHLQRNKLLFFQCTPGDSHSTLHPLRQTMQAKSGDHDSSLTSKRVARVFSVHGIGDLEVAGLFSFLLGAEGADPGFNDMHPEPLREKANWAIGQAMEAMCAGGPVMLIVEDIHWIDMSSKQLITELAKQLSGWRAMLIATTRPGVGGWLQRYGRHVMLKPLEHADRLRAIETMWPQGKRAADPELIELAERVAGGVPLFIEEVCQWMAETTDIEQLPQSSLSGRTSVFERVLSARLEPLGAAHEVARAASIAGNLFSLDLLAALLPDFARITISDALDTLVDADFAVRAWNVGGAAYRFRHALIQETIYNGTLRKRRQILHHRLHAAVSGNRGLAGWMTTAALAIHAERAGLLEEAIAGLVSAGVESSSRSAMTEARQLLERALALCKQLADTSRQDELQLSAVVALGPVLTAVEGPNSEYARKLYDEGVTIARRRPAAERAKWFPIYWGWWFTGSVVDGERAQAIVNDLQEVRDSEVQLQVRHCLWAVDFNRGSHDGCIEAVDAGLPLYDVEQGHANATRFGGHDAKVCGLAHRALSLWFSGRSTSALAFMAQARQWAKHTGHASSIAHALINEAMLHSYRRDFGSLRAVIADLRRLTEIHHLPSLRVSAQIFEGWCDGNAGEIKRGKDKMREGLGLHGEVQTPEDEPVYCGMFAELLSRSGEVDEALALLHSAIVQAEAGGSRYWLAELHRRTARILVQGKAGADQAATAFERCLVTAADQKAVPIMIAAYEDLECSNVSQPLLHQFASRVTAEKASLEPGAPLFVNREPAP
ncbi:hypothetical protein CN311_21335 [Mesorhizobium sanjuanii]|uniref:Guanylate cyclase domain-containing protein n=1 Tax=Mesorhizobium sanjuanii TaxID=2037900 RepID=A0A2A6FAZ1_9HYPH|nr:AAA family ATPase [Mesorhizobium sanjuanii]PDQ19099.1 hypothetical protein CN311_21335 [Mesorhizobium sanjuanii]